VFSFCGGEEDVATGTDKFSKKRAVDCVLVLFFFVPSALRSPLVSSLFQRMPNALRGGVFSRLVDCRLSAWSPLQYVFDTSFCSFC